VNFLPHQKKETASATDWLTMEEKYVQPEQNLIAINAAFRTFVRKWM
jgi:hypothetical protein